MRFALFMFVCIFAMVVSLASIFVKAENNIEDSVVKRLFPDTMSTFSFDIEQ